jgi:hypothetical protein
LRIVYLGEHSPIEKPYAFPHDDRGCDHVITNVSERRASPLGKAKESNIYCQKAKEREFYLVYSSHCYLTPLLLSIGDRIGCLHVCRYLKNKPRRRHLPSSRPFAFGIPTLPLYSRQPPTTVATCNKQFLRRPLCIAPQSHCSAIAVVSLYTVRDKSSRRMESKRKANGHAGAVEDLDDRAAKRRKVPVSLFSCSLCLCGVSVAVFKYVEMCCGRLGCDRLSITQLGESSHSNGTRQSLINYLLHLHDGRHSINIYIQ